MHLYDARTRAPVDSYDLGRVRDARAYTVPAFSPDGTLLAVASQQAVADPVRLLDPATMEPAGGSLVAPSGRPAGARDLAFSADGRFLVATVQVPGKVGEEVEFGDRTSVAVWDLRRPGSPPARVDVDEGFQHVAVSPDGGVVYTSAPMTAWDVATQRVIWRRDDIWSISGFDISPDGRRLASLRSPFDDNRVALVDTGAGETVRYLDGADEPLRDARFSADGSLVAAGTQDGEVMVWDAASGVRRERWETFEPAWGVDFTADGRQVLSSGVDGMLRFWDMAGQGTYLSAIAALPAAAATTHADPSPDGRHVAYRWLDDGGTGWISFLDARTGESTEARRLPVDEGPWVPGAWSPDGRRYVAHQGCVASCEGRSPMRLTVLDATSGDVLRSRHVVPEVIFSVAYTPSGTEILVADASGQIRVLDAETLVQTRLVDGLPSGGVDCCITPLPGTDTVVYLDGSDDAAVDRWRTLDLGDGQLTGIGRLTFRGYDMAASPDGARVAVAGLEGELVTVDVETGRQVRGSSPVGADVLWVAWSPDGTRLVTGTADGVVSLWDARDLELLGTVRPPGSPKGKPASSWFEGGSDDVLVAAYDGTLYRWRSDRERALHQGCLMAGRTLTRKEWAEYLPAQPYRDLCRRPPT